MVQALGVSPCIRHALLLWCLLLLLQRLCVLFDSKPMEPGAALHLQPLRDVTSNMLHPCSTPASSSV
jgi:hypothetical protein